jgi:peptide/nickel transport system substrate-binding protein
LEKNVKIIMAVVVAAVIVIASYAVLVNVTAGSTPSEPLNLQATRGDQQVALQWQAPSDDGGSSLEGYVLHKGTTSGNYPTSIDLDEITSYIDKDVSNGVTYYYRIAAKNTNGQGDKSNEASATPSAEPLTAPGAPRGLTAEPGQGSIRLSWQSPEDNGGSTIVNYVVEYKETSASQSEILNVGNVLECEIDGLSEAQYSFGVVAVNGVGTGPQTSVVSSPLAKVVENLNIGYVTTAGNHFGWQDMGTYLFRATVYQESLIGMDSDGNFTPRLAESWETLDSKTWTFHLTHNATWHDGVPFKASDVWFTINYTLEKRPWGMNDAKFMEQIQSVSMPDNYTIVIEMKSAYANLLNNMRIGLVVVPEHIYKFVDDPMTYGQPTTEMNATIGTGPYKAVSLDTTARLLKFTVNENYYGGVPSVKNITIRYYGNADSMTLALLNGDIDVTFGWGTGIEYYFVPQILANDDMGIILNPSVAIHALNFNCNQAPFDNESFREALSYALDYGQLKDIIMGGYGRIPNTGIVPSSMDGYVETDPFSTNVTKAKQMLDALGFVDVDSDGYREYPNGTKFQPQLLLSSTTRWVRSAEIIENNLKAVGVDVQLKIVTSGFAGEKAKRLYGMVLSGTSQAGTFAWESFYTVQVDGRGSLGDCQVFDPELQTIIDLLKNATTPTQKAEAAQLLQEYYSERIPSIPLYWFDNIQPYNKKYQGYGYDIGFGTIMCYDTYFDLRRA